MHFGWIACVGELIGVICCDGKLDKLNKGDEIYLYYSCDIDSGTTDVQSIESPSRCCLGFPTAGLWRPVRDGLCRSTLYHGSIGSGQAKKETVFFLFCGAELQASVKELVYQRQFKAFEMGCLPAEVSADRVSWFTGCFYSRSLWSVVCQDWEDRE